MSYILSKFVDLVFDSFIKNKSCTASQIDFDLFWQKEQMLRNLCILVIESANNTCLLTLNKIGVKGKHESGRKDIRCIAIVAVATWVRQANIESSPLSDTFHINTVY